MQVPEYKNCINHQWIKSDKAKKPLRGAVMSTIGENIKKLRESRGLTQQEVWERSKISKSSYTSYEAGKSMPSADRVLAIAEVLDVSTDQILRNKEQPLSKDLEYAIRRIQDLPIDLQIVAKTALRGLILGLEQEAMMSKQA